jgi:ABC-type transport system involved in multi-copper enzyme maturation permease subunit
MQRETTIRDVSGVRSRISWGAVFAGFFIALVSVVLLTSLGSAIGFTAARSNGVGTDQITTGAAIYGVIVTLFSLFVGGWATSQCVARETKLEAAFSGIVLWGVTFIALIFLALNGISLGLGTVMGINTLISNHLMTMEMRGLAQNLALTPDQMIAFQEMMRSTINQANVATATWWSFAGLVLSVLATVLGAIAGSGPSLSVRRLSLRHPAKTAHAVRM